MPTEILLINSPIRVRANPNTIPYGLATIASALRDNGFEVDIYDVNALRPSREEIVSTLRGKEWDIVGLSGLITTYKFQKWLFPELRKIHPSAPIMSGGGLATSNRELLFKNTDVDIAVLGEGEETMLELCRTLESGDDLGSVDGIWFRRDGEVFKNSPRKNIQDIDTIPFPAWDLLPIEIYLKNPIWGDASRNSSGFRDDINVSRSMNIISSRGCPFSCNYCYHLFGRSSYRFRSAVNVVKEIEILVDRYGVDFIGFVDDNMMSCEKHLLEFCDLLEKKRFPITWGCHGRVTNAKPEILKRMAEVGCVWIGYGIESGSQEILNRMNKRATVQQARKAILDTKSAGIYPNTTFIFGYPGETIHTINETIAFKKELGIECGSFFATPYPGTPLYNSIRERVEDEEPFVEALGDATDFVINLTDFKDEELFELKRRYDSNEVWKQ